MHLISNRLQKTSKCGKISGTLNTALCATVLVLTDFEVIFDLLYVLVSLVLTCHASIIMNIRSISASEEGQYISIHTLMLMFGKDMVDIL